MFPCCGKNAIYVVASQALQHILTPAWLHISLVHTTSTQYNVSKLFKVTGNALNIEYYFWLRDYCFGLLIHHDAPFHFMVSISDEYKYKR